MSAAPTPEQLEQQKFAQQFSKDMEVALHAVAAKYKGMIQDIVVVINWTHENHQKPYPKLIVETLRDVNDPSHDPIRQTLELGDLLNMGGQHVVRNTLFNVLQQNHELSMKLTEQAASAGPKLVIPGQ